MFGIIISDLYGAISCATRPSYCHKIDKLENTETDVYLRLCSKLNNTEAKLTRVSPHYFVIVIFRSCAWRVVALLSLLLIIDSNCPSSSCRQNNYIFALVIARCSTSCVQLIVRTITVVITVAIVFCSFQALKLKATTVTL